MALFDSLINEASEKFGLGGKAAPLLSSLLAMITSEESGGMTGFLSRFRTAGLGDLVSSWIGGGENKALSTGQLESALGSDLLSTLASKAGLSTASASPALAFLIPGIIDKLSPHGMIPTSLPESISGYLTGALGALTGAATGAFGAAGAGLSDAASAVTGAAGNLAGAASNAGASVIGSATGAAAAAGAAAKAGGSGLWRWLPLLGLLLLAFIGYRACTSQRTVTDETATVKPSATPATAAVTAPSVKPLSIAEAVKEAALKATAALTGLKPGFTSDELVRALNLEVINFASGSSGIPKDAEDLLTRSATAIKAAPAGTKLEVGGHTDNQGGAVGNQKLSQSRAEAVRAFLIKQGVKTAMLTSKGYGETKAVASNDTDEGRFKNRRIEFSVVK